MLTRAVVLFTLIVGTANAQTTYTGCHNHSEQGASVEYCFGPDGSESARATYAVSGTATLPVSASATVTATGTVQTTAVTDCHSHETAIFCINGAGNEVQVEATPTGEIPSQYTGCHSHGAEIYCLDPAGEEVTILSEESSTASEAAGSAGAEEENQHCHFHAGVEHCTGHSESEGLSCGLQEREYNVGLRVGTLFVILITSAIGVFAPMMFNKIPGLRDTSIAMTMLMVVKQFGTGIIIATAFIHLYTHAELMFSNECIGELGYEGTTSAIVMAGIFLSFLIDYCGHRYVAAKEARGNSDSAAVIDNNAADKGSPSGASSDEAHRHMLLAVDHHHGGGANTKLSVSVMEAGILFHSILIGLTLVVAGDSFYRTLLVVIVFHQFFEGLALGARIALLPGAIWPGKFFMALAFTLITPLGMAIGIGVLDSFNGNNPATVITFGTLDALSAGILVWVGVVDMWARDWVIGGAELLHANLLKTLGALFSLICGMVLMGVLGKWA
ncbi:uncharacterized protein MYCFIDRAFT_160766 [Pseudocercospora fijiensis CIRAD86]|uniref:Uncharacterized protein n=1 Tax=Pseudocercospora fijiensis (strain CIRAD86) TaxID=383855 RepID=N1QBN5_PSEFD|nr:uncharacterized protein MYCFIDRAFT_160766 [Pseudocercospora fijiensis CIRAD86]EME89571.1 hypothetical protein MYCFIDRAFT_160766 [Pseudocercospora fijiensis CIRAD86]